MQLQRLYHPDRYAASPDSEKLRAVQIAAHINGAHQTLSVPLKRAEYCLHLAGLSTDAETDAKMDPMFLMQQMEWREALEEVLASSEPFNALDAVRADINKSIASVAEETSRALEQKEHDSARELLRRWQFLEKLVQESNSVEARLDDD